MRPPNPWTAVLIVWALLGPLSPTAVAEANEPHDPICIGGNADFARPGSGVTGGKGTPSDPYVIAGWTIDTRTGNSPCVGNNAGIYIVGTSAHLIIRDVTVLGTEETVGIRFTGSNITLRGAQTNGLKVGIDASGADAAVEESTASFNAVAGITSEGLRVRIRGNNLEGNAIGLALGASHAAVDDNRITHSRRFDAGNSNPYGTDGHGIVVYRGDALFLSKNEILENEGDGVHAWPSPPDLPVVGTGWRVTDNTIEKNAGSGWNSAIVTNAVFERNRFVGNDGSGLAADGASESQLRSNSFNENGLHGVIISTGRRSVSSLNTVESNTVEKNGRSGLWFQGRSSTIQGNLIQSNGGPGALLMANATTFSRNTLAENGGAGVQVDGFGNALEANEIKLNHGAGILVAKPSGIHADAGSYDPTNYLTRNRFEGNTDIAIHCDHGATPVSLTGNDAPDDCGPKKGKATHSTSATAAFAAVLAAGSLSFLGRRCQVRRRGTPRNRVPTAATSGINAEARSLYKGSSPSGNGPTTETGAESL